MLAGDAQGGGSPLVGGAAVFAAWGEPARPGFPPGGNGKGGLDASLPQADFSGAAAATFPACQARSLLMLKAFIHRLSPGRGTYLFPRRFVVWIA